MGAEAPKEGKKLNKGAAEKGDSAPEKAEAAKDRKKGDKGVDEKAASDAKEKDKAKKYCKRGGAKAAPAAGANKPKIDTRQRETEKELRASRTSNESSKERISGRRVSVGDSATLNESCPEESVEKKGAAEAELVVRGHKANVGARAKGAPAQSP